MLAACTLLDIPSRWDPRAKQSHTMALFAMLRTAALFKSRTETKKRTSTRMCTGSFWSEQRDLNPRPPRPERGALPTALCPENTAAS